MTLLFIFSFFFFYSYWRYKKESLKHPPFLEFLNPTSYFNFLFFLSSFLICFSASSSSYLPTPWRCQRTCGHSALTVAEREHGILEAICSWKPNKWDLCTSWGTQKASVQSLRLPAPQTVKYNPCPLEINQPISLLLAQPLPGCSTSYPLRL